MAVKSLAQSSILQSSTTKSMLAGYESNYFHHLETVRLGGVASSITFSNLARYNDYQHLQLRVIARSNYGNVFDRLMLQFNGDTAGNYAGHVILGTGSSVVAAGGGSSVYPEIGLLTGNTNPSGHFAPSVIDILDAFETTKNKTTRCLSGQHDNSGETFIGFYSTLWVNSAATTSLTLLPRYGSGFVVGSRVSLYGLKARA